MDEVTIRPVAPGEHTPAGELVVEAYRTLGDVGDEFYESELRDVVGRLEAGEVLVAEKDGRILGCVTLSIGLTTLSEVEDPEAATIRMLGMSTSARGRGIGEALVRRCIDDARDRGCKRVRLHTRTSCRAHSDSMKGWASAATPITTGRLPRASRYSLTFATSSRAAG